MYFSPIALFVYNRPKHVQKVINSLKKNKESKNTEIFIFSDGPRTNDDDHHIQVLLNSLSKEQFLSIIIQIQSHEALYKIMMKYWDESLSTLTQIKDNG